MSFVNICQQTSVTRTKESPVLFLWRNVTAQKRRQTAAAAFSFDAEVLAGRSGLVPVSTFAFFPTCLEYTATATATAAAAAAPTKQQ
ncbi:hypothetical protein MY4038_005095 [Beauveria bassiana]